MVQVGPRPTRPAVTTTARTATPPRPPTGETPPHAEQTAARSRRYTFELPITPEFLPFLALMVLGFVLRVFDLGEKALHHDESLHAVYSWYLYQGRGYTHDPMMHGPLLFIGNALAYLLLGASDFSARIVPALLGVALIGMPWFLRNELGKAGAVAAAAFFTISPTFLYFSRFIRHDIYVDVFTLLMVIGVFRYLATGTKAWFQAAVVGAALLFATKEDFYISGFIPFTFLVGCWFLLRGERRQAFRARVRALGWQSWAIGVGVFLAINLVLYTTFFTNMRGICTALVTIPVDGCAGAKGALSYWLDQHDVRRGGQPWFYYTMLLGLYELLPLGLAVLALFFVRGKNLFFWFSVYWFVGALAIYSWAGEKMPWMLPQITLPLVFVASYLVGQWVQSGRGRLALQPRGLAVGGLVLLGAFALLAWVGMGAASVVVPVDQQRVMLQRIALAIVVAATAGGLVTLGSRWGRQYVAAGAALGLLAIFGTIYARTAIAVTYEHPDTPVEPLIYVQSSPDVVWITREIERVANQTGMGKDVRILMDNGWNDGVHEAVAWPFEWYLRDYKQRRYFNKTIDPAIASNLSDYPVILAMASNTEPIQAQLQSYNTQKYHLNWWFPEDYKQFAAEGLGFTVFGKRIGLPWLDFGRIGSTLANPENRVKLLKFLLYREAPNTLAGRELIFGVHTSVPSIGPSPTGGRITMPAPAAAVAQPAVNPNTPREAVLQQQPDGSAIFGRSAAGAPQLLDVKDAALGPDGKLYVVEGRAARVTVFNPDGTIAQSWGRPGQGDGEFQEPWGIAVAPNGEVYVADTWNHRVQRFDASGKFLGKWGRLGDARGQVGVDQGVFWGPRSIAISPQGEVYVTDTGNKRVQVFDLQGSFRRMFGGEGSAPGQLREPVGVSVDPRTGNVWVADAWNTRIQQLDPSGQPISAFAVEMGWESTSVTNKPYLAVGPQGQIAATSPDRALVTVYGPDGRVLREYSLPQTGSAVGVEFGPDGRLYATDSRNGVVYAYPAGGQ